MNYNSFLISCTLYFVAHLLEYNGSDFFDTTKGKPLMKITQKEINEKIYRWL
jgi:hypothetical protein